MTKIVMPFGLWPSPLPAEAVAGRAVRFSRIEVGDGALYWSELRPYEMGRTAIMRLRSGETAEDLLPPPFSARSRVHEYGGGEFMAANDQVYFVNESDQDVWRLVNGEAARVTCAPDTRFADFTFDARRNRLIAVAEFHDPAGPADRPSNMLCKIDPGQPPGAASQPLITGRDFYASPRISPDGRSLAWLAWDLPHMPWEAAALFVADLDEQGQPGRARRIAGGGGGDGAAFQPEWREDGALVFAWDKTGWGNLYAWDGDAVQPLVLMEAEFAMPMWSLNARSFALLPGMRVAACPIIRGEATLGVADANGKFTPIKSDARGVAALTASETGVIVIGARNCAPPAIIRIGFDGTQQTLREGATVTLEPGDISVARTVSFPGDDGRPVYGLYYPPQNSRYEGPSGKAPPAVIRVHGGPHSQAQRGLSLSSQYWTTRGFAFFDLDYGGSTGYGRAYRTRLDGQWGVRDVADAVAAARWLAKEGLAQHDRIVITGGSAGGYTVLMALASAAEFAAGAVYYGVSDLAALQRSTHKFEAGYLFNLLGVEPGPGGYSDTSHPVFRERSPVGRAGAIRCPVILFQGTEDKVTPPEQSRVIAEELERHGVPVALHEFENEGHGFRRAETVSKALREEYDFYRWALRLEE
jgi:dipeptidyl aminopeptidase/acylaminoacyl peptidase